MVSPELSPARLLYRDLEDAMGGLREDYFGEAVKQAGIRFQYLKSTRGAKTPDFFVDDGHDQIAVEIGGRGKGRETTPFLLGYLSWLRHGFRVIYLFAGVQVGALTRPSQYFGRLFWWATARITTNSASTAYTRL